MSYLAVQFDIVYCTRAFLRRNVSVGVAMVFWGWLLFAKPLCFTECKFSPSRCSFHLFLIIFPQYMKVIKDTIQIIWFLTI